MRTVTEVFRCGGIQENSLWQPSCAPAKVSCEAAKRRLKNVGLNTRSLFILFDCIGKRRQCNGDSGVKNTSDSFMLLLYTHRKNVSRNKPICQIFSLNMKHFNLIQDSSGSNILFFFLIFLFSLFVLFFSCSSTSSETAKIKFASEGD